MIVRREAFRDVGLLDEDFFTYFEDVDFCFRAFNARWKIWYVPESRVIHLVGQSSGITFKQSNRMPPYVLQARRLFFLKNFGMLAALLADIGLILGLALWRLRVLLGKEDSLPPCYFRDCITNSVFLTGFKVSSRFGPSRASMKVQNKA